MSGCGTCTLCCKVMAVDEIAKPRGQWCTHCNIGAGCRVYDARPKACADFECVWLQSQSREKPLGPELRPDRCRVVLAPTNDGAGIVAHVDPGMPSAWERGAIGDALRAAIRKGAPVVIACGNRRRAFLPDMPPELFGQEFDA